MGFFSNIKKNFNHGGVTLDLVSPDTVRLTDESAQLQLTITNTSTEQIQVNKCTVSLHVKDKNIAQATDPNYQRIMDHDVLKMTFPEVFTIPAGQQQVLPITFLMKAAPAAQQSSSAIQSVLGQVADVLAVKQDMDYGNNAMYTFDVTVDVEGISFDPATSKSVHVLGPNEVGSGNFKLSF